MRYLGSKVSLLKKIEQLIDGYKGGIFCDPFGGIGTVGAFMKQNGYRVVTGDILKFAYYFQRSIITFEDQIISESLKKSIDLPTLEELEIYLSSIITKDGWLIEEYARKRQFFTIENAYHIQACIDCINSWRAQRIIDEDEYIILVTSLINSFDKVANTAGTYYAYLKHFYRKAMRPFRFSLVHPREGMVGCAYQMNANDLVKQTECDILYLDPPYNSRDYGSYYHLPETVSLGVEPKPTGKSGVFHTHKRRSEYNGTNATAVFEKLIKSANAKCIIFHYTDNGLIDMDRAKITMQEKGTKFEEYYFDCRGYTTTKETANNSHHIMKVSL